MMYPPKKKPNRMISATNHEKKEGKTFTKMTLILFTNGSKVMNFREGNPLTPHFVEVCISTKIILDMPLKHRQSEDPHISVAEMMIVLPEVGILRGGIPCNKA